MIRVADFSDRTIIKEWIYAEKLFVYVTFGEIHLEDMTLKLINIGIIVDFWEKQNLDLIKLSSKSETLLGRADIYDSWAWLTR